MKKIIGIFGVPRSGTSWLGQIFNSSPEVRFAYQPMFTDKFRDRIHARSSEDDMRNYFKEIYESEEDFLTQKDGKEKGDVLTFYKEKEFPDFFVFKEVMYLYMIPRFLRNIAELKVVMILRNPYDVLQSWYNAPKEFYPEWNIEDEWMFAQSKNWFLPERYYGYHRWKESIALADSLQREFPDRVYIIRYEDLDNVPIDCVKQIFEFAEISFSLQTEQFINESRSRTGDSPYSIFRSTATYKRGAKKLPQSIIEKISCDLERFSLSKKWEY